MSGALFPAAPISLPSPTIVGPAGANFVCLVGFVNLFQFIQPPPPGSVVGTLATSVSTIPLVQTNPTVTGGAPLASVDRQLATLCGDLSLVQGQLALDVRSVSPGFSPITPGLNPLLLLLLLLLGGRE
jgi:hypothetical protein